MMMERRRMVVGGKCRTHLVVLHNVRIKSGPTSKL